MLRRKAGCSLISKTPISKILMTVRLRSRLRVMFQNVTPTEDSEEEEKQTFICDSVPESDSKVIMDEGDLNAELRMQDSSVSWGDTD